MDKIRSNKIHYAWKIMIACIFMKLGNGGVVASIAGNFVTPIVNDLGCRVSEFTMLVSIEAVAMACFYTLAAKFLVTKKIGRIIGLASLAEIIGVMLMASYRSVYMFYVSGIIIGVAQAFTGFVAIPIVINMWFHKKAGTVLGIVIAVSSAATVGYGLLSAQLITVFGWRAAYLILGIMGFVITVPMVFLVIKSPDEVGCKAYGADENDEAVAFGSKAGLKASPKEIVARNVSPGWGITRKEAFRSPVFYLAWLTCLCYSIGSGVSGYIATFSTMEMKQTISFGAKAGMFLYIGTIACSIILGHINDRFGVKMGLAWGTLFTTLGYGMMFLAFKNVWCIMPAALVVGLGNSMYTVQSPLIARSVLGEKEYSSIWSVMMIGNSLIGGGLYSAIGLFYDKLGSYQGAFILAIVLHIGALIIGTASVLGGQRLRREARAL